MEIFKDMLDVYGKLSGFKFKGSITATRFVKLASYEGMTNQKICKIDYDLIFKKILKNNFSSQHMDFYDFIRAVEEITMRLDESYDPKNKLPSVSNMIQNLQNQMN